MSANLERFKPFVACTIVLVLAGLLTGCSVDPDVRKQQFLESGNRYFEQKEYRPAIIEYQNAIALDATFGPARAALAESFASIGETSSAAEEYVRAADLLPADFDLQLRAGEYLLAAGNADQALVRAEAALKLQPSSVPGLILRGNALAGLSAFDKALESIEQAIRLEPELSTSFTHKGFIELARGRRDEAEEAFKRAVALAPSSVDSHLAIGNYYWAVGRPVEAENAFQAALGIDPSHLGANRAMAALMLATNRTPAAERYLRAIADHASDPGAVLVLADYYLLSGRVEDAISRLLPLTAEGKVVPGAKQRLARAYAVGGMREKAATLVDEILQASPRDIDAQLLKAQLMLDEGRRDDALSLMRAAVTAAPSSVEAQYALGKLYAARGDATAAEAAFREVLKLNPRVAGARIELARLQLSSGNAEASVRTAEDAARTEPANLTARLTLIRSLLAAKDLARAEREIAAVQASLPQLPAIHAQRGVLALHRGDARTAREAFERALALDPGQTEAVAGLITLDLNARQFDAARARVNALVGGEAPRAEWLLLAARTYASMQDFANTERFLRRAIQVEPTLLPGYAMLGQLYLGQKRLEDARKEFEALAARQSKPVAALTMSAIILQQQGKTVDATKRFEDVLAIDPRAAIAANNLAWIYADSGGNLDAALQLALTATTASPDVPELMDTLGWVYYKKALPQLAIPQFRRAVEKAPGQAAYQYHLGLAYLQAGDGARARASLNAALAIEPEGQTAGEIRRLLAGT